MAECEHEWNQLTKPENIIDGFLIFYCIHCLKEEVKEYNHGRN